MSSFAIRSSLLAPLAGTALLAGCHAAPELRTDGDPAADLSRYRSFKFVPAPAMYMRGYPSVVIRQVAGAITSEMVKRGYHAVSSYPDLVINFSREPRTDKAGSEDEGYYTYRYYPAWPGYALGDTLETIVYAPGTLAIDVIDRSRMQLVWEAVAIGAVASKGARQEAEIRDTVAELFAHFPVRPPEQPQLSTSQF